MASTLGDLSQSSSPDDTPKTFQGLPTEIRLKIWKESLKDPRDVHVRVITTSFKGSVTTAFKLMGKGLEKEPSLIYTCLESREEALKIYVKAFETFGDQSDDIYINPDIDTLIIHIHNPTRGFESFILDQSIRAENNSYMEPPSVRNSGDFGQTIGSGFWASIKQLEYGYARMESSPRNQHGFDEYIYVFSASAKRGRPYEEGHSIESIPGTEADIKQRLVKALERGLSGPVANMFHSNHWDAERWVAACKLLVREENNRLRQQQAFGFA